MTVESFDGTIRTMSSLRKPKRVAFLCSDQVERNFLVKGGEDLRQDQRIQLLFAVMNGILSQSAPCKARELSMRTFAVCPLSDNVGLIEWMDGTSPLKSVIGSAYKSDSGVPLKGKEKIKALGVDEVNGKIPRQLLASWVWRPTTTT